MTDEEKKLNEAIKQDGIATQPEILDELKRRYPQYSEISGNNKEIERMKELLADNSEYDIRGDFDIGKTAKNLAKKA